MRQIFGVRLFGHSGYAPASIVDWSHRGVNAVTASFTSTRDAEMDFPFGHITGDFLTQLKFKPTIVFSLSPGSSFKNHSLWFFNYGFYSYADPLYTNPAPVRNDDIQSNMACSGSSTPDGGQWSTPERPMCRTAGAR